MPRRAELKSVLVIGSGPIVIGQACEFDYSGTQACRVLRQEGIRVSLVNSNPATIMTDPEFADSTYVEPITVEVLEKVIERERPDAILATLGGQTALNAAVALHDAGTLARYGVELIGADIDAIRAGEDRNRFKQIVTGLGAQVPDSRVCHTMEQCEQAAAQLGFPVVLRPSFTLGGSGSGVARDAGDLRRMAAAGLDASPVTEVLLEESILGWKEFELELMRDRRDNVVVVCTIENIDPMGVHTGDSVTVAPAMTLTDREYQHMRDVAIAVLRAVGVDTGGCNIQFAVHPATGRMVVIEMNPPGVPVIGAGLQGDRLPDRQDRRAAGHRLHPGRDTQRHHRRDPGLLRACPGLRGGQGAQVRLREIPRRRPSADHAHEVGRRGDGDRPQLRRGAGQGAALAGAERRGLQLAGPGRGGGRADRALRGAARRQDGDAAPGDPRGRQRQRPGRGDRHRSLVPRSDRWHRGTCETDSGWRAADRRVTAGGEGCRVLRRPDRAADGIDRSAGPRAAPGPGSRAGLSHGGHLRGGVRRPHALPVLDL